MIKEIRIENLYNFKEEILLDFTTTESEGKLVNEIMKENVSQISLIYGKNNVGKSNSLRILQEIKELVLNDKWYLERYKPNDKNKLSTVELIFGNETNEIRYGFEINCDKEEITDEWMFAKVNKSTRESRIFERSESYFSHLLSSASRQSATKINNKTLIMHILSKIDSNSELINQSKNFFKSVLFVECNKYTEELPGPLLEKIMQIRNDSNRINLLNAFLQTADLDIKEVKLGVIGDEEAEFLEKMRLIYESDEEKEEKNKRLNEIMSEHSNSLMNVVQKNIIGMVNSENLNEMYSLEFINQSGASFFFAELSSGTKQLINIVLTIITSIGKEKIILFDEIENGLHNDLLELILYFMENISRKYSGLQFIITTHNEQLLDLESVSKQNKIFMIKNKNIEIFYLSEYKQRDYHMSSKRYRLNAYQTNPNTTNRAVLLEYIDDIDTYE